MQPEQLAEVSPASLLNTAVIAFISSSEALPEKDLILKRLNYHSRLRRVMIYLTDNATAEITLQIAARVACMEKTSFSRFFSRAVGITFREFLQRWRIAIAVNQILNSDASLTEIAYSAGFASMSAFERTFKKITTLSP